MRLYLSWIEGSATNRNAGGSSPSRRAKKRADTVRCLLFLCHRGTRTLRGHGEKRKGTGVCVFRAVVRRRVPKPTAWVVKQIRRETRLASLKARQKRADTVRCLLFLCHRGTRTPNSTSVFFIGLPAIQLYLLPMMGCYSNFLDKFYRIKTGSLV